MLTTPIVFIIFNRPDLTQLVFNAIREAQPKQLFVVADGPRFIEEAEKCQQARNIIEQVDWDCQVYTNYSDINLGCRQRVSSGITWVFEQVEEAIILEDDCLPTASFFPFCQTLLDYYRNDTRIFVISGNNFQDGLSRTEYTYYFSKYNHCWGWATWRRAWQYWDCNIDKWLKFKNSGLIEQIFDDSYEKEYWIDIFDGVFLENKPNSWAYLWTFACWSEGGLSILPNHNLVSNIGFRQDGTNITIEDHPYSNLPTKSIIEIKHPPFLVRHKQADIYTFDHVFGGMRIKEEKSRNQKFKLSYFLNKAYYKNLINLLKSLIKKLFNRIGYDIIKHESLKSLISLPEDFTLESIKIIELVKTFSLTSNERLNGLIEATRYITNKKISGSIVECGVWKGGSMMAVAYMLKELGDIDRDLYLFDTYEGMSEPTDRDITYFNADAKSLLDSDDTEKKEAYFCYASLEEVKDNLFLTQYPKNKIHFIKGKVEDTIPKYAPEQIALLRLDTDWYESTKHELQYLFPLLAPGGVIIIDDYGYWKGCKQATDEYLENNKIPLFLSRLDSTGRIGVKH